jgi:GNAT superfamily N-acetyltransferase
MPAPEVRLFRRTDRDQLTDLVNLHVAAVVPGVSVSVSTVLGDLKRQPGEFITDPCQFARWSARVRYADGSLPAPLVYGLPRNWPHIRALYERAGFRHTGDTEVILLARVADLPAPETRPGVTAERTLGECGTRFTARAEGRTLGHIEIDTALARPERHARAAGLADIGNLHIDPARHGTGLEHWLLARAADWLRLCGVDRLVAYEPAADSASLALLTGAGFRELTRTDRGWVQRPDCAQMPGR